MRVAPISTEKNEGLEQEASEAHTMGLVTGVIN